MNYGAIGAVIGHEMGHCFDDQGRNSDSHSPGMFRANGPVRNFDPWYAAFDVKPGDKLYLSPDQRVRIW